MHGWTRFCCGLALLLAIFVPSHSATTVNAKADDPQLSAQIGIVAPTAEQITSPVAPIHSLELQSTIATMVQQAELIVRAG
ncbi:MAG: hypothetical protein R2867_34965 [Caldilineaceae bacterium]